MSFFVFNFNNMLDWCKRNINNDTYFDDDKNMVSVIIEGDTVSLYENNIRKIKLIKPSKFFPLGLYFLNDIKNNNLYFIFPNEKSNIQQNKITFGDYISFKHKNNTTTINISIYQPYSFNINTGYCSNAELYLKDNTILPLEDYDCNIFNDIQIPLGISLSKKSKNPFNKEFLDISRIYTQNLNDYTEINETVNSQTIVSIQLKDLLIHEKINNLLAFGFNVNNEWNFTTFVGREEEQYNNESEEEDDGRSVSVDNNYIFDYSFITKTKEYNVFENKLIKTIEENISE